MPNDHDDFLTWGADRPGDPDLPAPHKLMARLYSALVAEQQESGRLRSLPQTKASGHGLCVFEDLVRIAPAPESTKHKFICWTCHARVLAENMENAPIWWPNCPYSRFQKS
jgi:hypothetical protein